MEYIELKKSTYSILPKGIFLIETLEKLNIDMSKEKTVYLNKLITDVYKNKITIDQALAEVNKEIEMIFNQTIEAEKNKFSNAPIIGICPKCGKNVIEYNKAFSCESGKEGCGFVVWKEIAHKKITATQVKKLLLNKKTDLIKGFISKSGKNFDAFLILKDDFTIGFKFK